MLGLLPFAPVKIWTASRYTYDAVAFFAPLAAIAGYQGYARLRDVHPRARMPATVAALAVVAVIAGAVLLADVCAERAVRAERRRAGSCW